MEHQKSLLKNIKDQIKRLLDQLAEIEEEKDNLEPSEYEEMQKETIAQLEEFKQKLDQFSDKDLRSEAEIQKATMQKAISQAYNQDKLKQIVSTKNAEKLRAEIKKLAVEVDSDGTTAKEIIKLISQIRDDGADLTNDEQKFLESFEGSDFTDVHGDAADMMTALLKKFS